MRSMTMREKERKRERISDIGKKGKRGRERERKERDTVEKNAYCYTKGLPGKALAHAHT